MPWRGRERCRRHRAAHDRTMPGRRPGHQAAHAPGRPHPADRPTVDRQEPVTGEGGGIAEESRISAGGGAGSGGLVKRTIGTGGGKERRCRRSTGMVSCCAKPNGHTIRALMVSVSPVRLVQLQRQAETGQAGIRIAREDGRDISTLRSCRGIGNILLTGKDLHSRGWSECDRPALDGEHAIVVDRCKFDIYSRVRSRPPDATDASAGPATNEIGSGALASISTSNV